MRAFILSRLIQLFISTFCFDSFWWDFAMRTSIGWSFLKLTWYFLVVSRNISLIFLAMKAGRFISETLKNVMKAKTKTISKATTIQSSLASALEKLLNAHKAITIPIAIINIWSIEILKPKMVIEKPEKNHFWIFWGKRTFIWFEIDKIYSILCILYCFCKFLISKWAVSKAFITEFDWSSLAQKRTNMLISSSSR